RPKLKPVSSHKLARKIDASGKTIRNTSNSAAENHTGKVASQRCRTDQLAAGARSTASVLEAGMELIYEPYYLCAENFDEAFSDFGVALFQLVGVRGEKLQILEFRFIRRVGHFRMTGVESLFVGQQLLRLFRNNELRKKLRRVRVWRIFGDGNR